MKRRNFIRKIGLASAGAFSAPYILPGGRLFAQTGARKVNHVVFCLFAGGVRNLEALKKSEGNLMPNIIPGSEAISQDLLGSLSPLPDPFSLPLQNFGTLFKEFRYKTGPTGHYNAHATAVTGVYSSAEINITQRPDFPTIFEYYRKHNIPESTALNAWWISNALGPFPSLNFSNYQGYGANYGANYIQPQSIISQSGFNVLGDPKEFSDMELQQADKFRGFFDDNFSNQFTPGDAGVINTSKDQQRIQDFITRLFEEAVRGAFVNPWNLPPGGNMSGDMTNIFFTEKVIEEFKPELTVVNMQDVDVCHNDFSSYCNNLRKSDYALAHLWDFIQKIPGMANDTILIAAPEHGRNLETNTVIDENGRFAIDHTNTPVSREIFCLILGPQGVVKQNQGINQELGESIDIVPTIANILGFDTDISAGLLQGSVLEGAFV
ncbi:MAG: hypothetical protein O6848_08285 [Bacteroidetes bacterium]|nr:hypothetical protein [Bacteroidota bacterium]